MIRNYKVKMVVLIATALTIGVGAIAACVVPWYYYKQPNDDDENHESTGFCEDTQTPPQSGSVAENNFLPVPNIRIRGCNFVKVVVPPTPPRSIDRSVSTTSFSEVNSTTEGSSESNQADNVRVALQFPETSDSITSVIINSENIQMNRTYAESTRKFDNSEVTALKKEDMHKPLTSDIENLGVFNSALNMEQSLVTLRSNETSNPTDQSSTEETNRSSSVTSDLLRVDSIEEVASDSKDFCSEESKESSLDVTDSESTLPASSTQTEYSTSRTLTTSGSSNPTNNWSTETTNGESTSQELENSSSGPTRVQTIAIVESSSRSFLETIPEVSTSRGPSLDPSPRLPRQIASSKLHAIPNIWIGNETSITPTSTRTTNGIASRSIIPITTASVLGSPDSSQSTCSKHYDSRVRNKTSHYTVFNRIRNILRGVRYNAETKSGIIKNNQKLHQESIKSLSSGKKIPTGHSTLISEDQQIFQTIRTQRSPQNRRILKVYKDPGIFNSNNLNYIHQFRSDIDEFPLDLSVRSYSDSSHEKTEDTSNRRKSIAHSAEVCKQLFREMADSLRTGKNSKSSEDSSSMSCDKNSKIWMTDENQNVTSDFRNIESVNVKNTDNCSKYSEPSKLGCLSKTNGFPQKIKKILHIGGKDESNKSKILDSMRKGRILNSVPVEFQRYSSGTSSQVKTKMNERNPKIFGTFDAPTDLSSYCELGFSSSDCDLPWTEL